MAQINGMGEYREYVRLHGETDSRGEVYRQEFFEDELVGLEVSDVSFAGEVAFRKCVLRDLNIRDVSVRQILIGSGEIHDSIIDGFSAEDYNIGSVDLYNTVVRRFRPKYAFFGVPFGTVAGCEFLDMRVNNREGELFKNLVDSKVTGVLREVVFTENEQRTQCRGVDFSELKLNDVEFFGVDMGRVVANPVWGWAIVPEWFQYVDRLREVAATLRAADNRTDVRAGIAIEIDLEYDERGYGRPLDAQRGAKLVKDVLPRTNPPELSERIREVYADLGVELNPTE